jgi:hypothetical protein
MMRWVLAGIVVIGLAACSGYERDLTYREMDAIARRSTEEQVHRPAPDTCQMAQYTHLVGAVGAEIDRTELPAGARVICHDCSVTLDYRADRLNIDLGADGKVARLHCG